MNKNYKLILLSFLSFLIVFTSLSQTIIRGPYLQKGTPTSVVVKWRTAGDADTQIEYSLDENFSSSTLVPLGNLSIGINHEIEISGLVPYTKYYYRIPGSNLSNSSDLYFKTHPSVGTSGPYRFWVLGNTGEGDSNAANVRNAYYAYDSNSLNETNAMLFLGDNAYNSGTDLEYQTAVFDMYKSKLKNTIAWSCLGNHDGYSVNSGSQTGPYYDIFTFPTSGESGGMDSGTESYYSFDYGNIHFIVLNSFDENRALGSAMYNWALSDIQNTDQKWIVAFWHHPPYSKGWYDSDTGLNGDGEPSGDYLSDMRENFLPMLEENGVDLVLTAHSLSYERSYMINGHYGLSNTFDLSTHAVGDTGQGDGQINSDGAYSKTSLGNNAGLGTVYVVTSTASQKVTTSVDHPAMYYSAFPAQFGSGVLEVDGNELTFKFLSEFGSIDDFFTIQKIATSLSIDDKCFNGLQIFTSANPKLLHVNGKLTDSSILDLYDIQGRLVLTKKLDINNNSNVIGIESMGIGVYIVKLKIGGLTRTQKVIIR